MGKIQFAEVDDYHQKMDAIYSTIAGNPVGKVIIADINATSRNLIFKPRKQADIRKYGVCDAVTESLDPAAAAPKGVGGKGPAIWYKGYPDDVNTPNTDERYEPSNIKTDDSGTGEGSSVEIGFDPDKYTETCIKRGPASQADEVLLHEMVHALRMMQGQFNKVPTKNAFYDDEEEFLSIVIANVYVSQKDPAAPLRGNHHDHDKLWPPLNTSAGFVAHPDNYRILQIYRLVWLPTFTNLAMLVTPTFNPFREVRNKLGDVVEGPLFPPYTLSPDGTTVMYRVPGRP